MARCDGVRWCWLLAFGVAGIAVLGMWPVTVTDDAEALARVIRSEAGVSPPVQQVHVAWARA